MTQRVSPSGARHVFADPRGWRRVVVLSLALGVGGLLVGYVIVVGASLVGGPEVPRLNWRHARAELNLVGNSGGGRVKSRADHAATGPGMAPAGSAVPSSSPQPSHVSSLGVAHPGGFPPTAGASLA
ncbi:MAG TPA: hypothetical protein VIV12_11930 [Streptosporangiaceae bacterium]